MVEKKSFSEIVEVSIDKLVEFPNNPRVGNLDLIKESLKQHNQYRPLTINKKDNYILTGNHTWKAMKELGYKKVFVNYVDVPMNKAKKIVLVDNRLNDLAGYDKEKMTSLLNYFMELGDLEGTGFDPDEVDNILAAFDKIEVTEFEEFKGGYALSEEELERIQKERYDQAETNGGRKTNDVPIVVNADDYDLFQMKIEALAEHFQSSSSFAVLESVKMQHKGLPTSKFWNLLNKEK